jgi:DNA-binding GntR family transcriptional regulator
VQPVRVAVSRLIADEALEVTPNRAVRVPLMSAARFEELTTIRLAIEGFAIERAATRRTAAELAQVRRHDRAFRRQCRSRTPDPALAVQANHDLHFTAYRAAGLPTLMPIIEGLWLRIGPVLNLDMRSSPRRLQMGQAETSHAALVEALQARAPAAARAALQADIGTASRFILERGILPRA